MSEVYNGPATHVPNGAIIEDHAGALYTAVVGFVWEVQLAAIYKERPHLNPKAYFDTDYDEEQIQTELFEVLVAKDLLKKVEPNFSAMTHIHRNNNTADTSLYQIVAELRGPIEKVSA